MAGLIEGPATPPARWTAAPQLRELPLLDLTGCRRLVVVAAHPDDETLGVGGLLATVSQAGVEVDLLVLTDGEASHPGSPTLGPVALAVRRRAEVRAALALLGVRTPAQHAGLPDGSLTALEDQAAAAIDEFLAAGGTEGTWVLAPWHGDGHPDHGAAARAATATCDRRGVPLLEYLLWAWHWAAPGDVRLPWDDLVRHPLDKSMRSRKRAAVGAFRTQVEPLSAHPADAAVVPSTLVDAVCGGPELLVRALRM